jgi:hypothetical protein
MDITNDFCCYTDLKRSMVSSFCVLHLHTQINGVRSIHIGHSSSFSDSHFV